MRTLTCRTWDITGRFTLAANSDDNATAFVVSAIHRRHLSTSQRAVLAVELLPHFAAEAKRRQREHGFTAPGKVKSNTSVHMNGSVARDHAEARDQAAKAVGLGGATVFRAQRVAEQAPDLFKRARDGDMTANRAYAEMRARPERDPGTPSEGMSRCAVGCLLAAFGFASQRDPPPLQPVRQPRVTAIALSG